VLPPFEAAAVWHEERLAPVTQKFLGYLEEELDSLGYGPGRCPGIGQGLFSEVSFCMVIRS
jgi:hypothetical protein